MSKKCPWCDSINSIVDDREFEGRLYCKKCRTSILKGEETACTIFDRITASPEVLAEKLVYYLNDAETKYIFDSNSSESCRLVSDGWTSNLLNMYYDTKAEAIAATVAKLKEVVE